MLQTCPSWIALLLSDGEDVVIDVGGVPPIGLPVKSVLLTEIFKPLSILIRYIEEHRMVCLEALGFL